MNRFLVLFPILLLAACAPPIAPDAHVPVFAKKPYEPFSRDAVVQIALREWRLFGQLVDDDFPAHRPAPGPAAKPERWTGLWQRIGEYWWLGLNATAPEIDWTGKHGSFGAEFPAAQDGEYAWSAAFISYVMRIAGAGRRFPYAPSHWEYIDRARLMVDLPRNGWVMTAERVETYAPLPGDLICMGRGRAGDLRYEHLPAGPFPAHCDIVVQAEPEQLAVIGGNFDDAVTLKHIPLTPDGKLATPDGKVVDERYPWMVVLRLLAPAPVS
jgi:hypothetical protein